MLSHARKQISRFYSVVFCFKGRKKKKKKSPNKLNEGDKGPSRINLWPVFRPFPFEYMVTHMPNSQTVLQLWPSGLAAQPPGGVHRSQKCKAMSISCAPRASSREWTLTSKEARASKARSGKAPQQIQLSLLILPQLIKILWLVIS